MCNDTKNVYYKKKPEICVFFYACHLKTYPSICFAVCFFHVWVGISMEVFQSEYLENRYLL